MDDSQTARLWELDFFRGMAIILMVLFHLAFDLNYFGIHKIELSSSFWFYLPRLTVSLFLFLVGISLTLSHSRARMMGQESAYPIRLIKRSLWILSLALGITAVTYIFIGRGFIIFGVLHLIAISLLLAYPLLRLQSLNFAFGLAAILLGRHIQELDVHFFWLIWLGLAPQNFVSLDYTPLLPWFGVVLMGMASGTLLYKNFCRTFPLPDLSMSPVVGSISFLGKNSLAIYLFHQPALIGLIYLIEHIVSSGTTYWSHLLG